VRPRCWSNNGASTSIPYGHTAPLDTDRPRRRWSCRHHRCSSAVQTLLGQHRPPLCSTKILHGPLDGGWLLEGALLAAPSFSGRCESLACPLDAQDLNDAGRRQRPKAVGIQIEQSVQDVHSDRYRRLPMATLRDMLSVQAESEGRRRSAGRGLKAILVDR
jgi:hypothetical protein